MVRAICSVKLLDKRRTEDSMGTLGLYESVEQLAMANGVRWYGHNVPRRVLEFKVNEPRKRGLTKKTCREI